VRRERERENQKENQKERENQRERTREREREGEREPVFFPSVSEAIFREPEIVARERERERR